VSWLGGVPFLLEVLIPTIGIGEVGISTVDDDIAYVTGEWSSGGPCSRWGNSASMNASTAGPAFTSNIILRGRFNSAHSSGIECAPTIDFPHVSFTRRTSTFGFIFKEMIDLRDRAVKCRDSKSCISCLPVRHPPWSAMLRISYCLVRPFRELHSVP
jgi:hypothetical protein